MALFAAPASATQGLFDFFGHTGSGGGEFAAGLEAEPTPGQNEKFEPGPAGIAVNDTTGNIYVTDRANNRIQQFDFEYNLIRAWGIDTIPSGAAGTGTLLEGSNEVTSVATTSKAFIPGQEVSGTGIPPGTRIREVRTGNGAASKLILSEKATASGTGVVITAAGSPANVAQNEVQTVSVKAAANSFKLKFTTTMPTAEATTASIAFDASAATVQSALEALANIGAGNVEVGGAAGGPYTVEFKGKFADTNVAQLVRVAGTPDLTGPPGPTVLIATEQEGAGRFEKCTTATTCQAGAPSPLGGGMNLPSGLAVNQATGNVYVMDSNNARVNQYDEAGTFVRTWGTDVVASGPGNKPEVQSVKVAASSGTFTLSFFAGGIQTTSPLPYNASAAEVESALNGLNSIGGAFGSVSVSGGPGDPTGSSPYEVTFGGALANSNVNQISINPGGLGGGEGTTSTVRNGASAEICNAGVDVCKTEANAFGSDDAGGTFAATNEPNGAAIAPGGPYAGDLFVADAENARIQIFDSDSGAFVAAFGKDVLQSGTETVGKNVCIAALGNVCTGGDTVRTENTYGFGNLSCSCGREEWPRNFAIDADGWIYVPGWSNKFLQKYSPDLSSELDFAPYLCTHNENPLGPEPNGCSEVAVDLSTNDVYVAYGVRGERERCGGLFGCEQVGYTKERGIARLDSAGSEPPLEKMLEGFGIRYINGMVVDGSSGEERSGRIYVTVNHPEQRVDVIGEGTPPTVEFEPIDPAEVKAHEVTVRATINPNGDSVDTKYQFETLIQGGVWKPYPVPPGSVGNGTSPVALETVVPNLRANTKYRIRLAVFKTERQFSPEQTFTTPASGPAVETAEARWSGPPWSSPSLTFFGTVDNKNLPAHYFFEYGADGSYGKRVPLFETGSHSAAQEPFLARQTVNGLDPNGSYHYRLVARTESGTTFGADREVGPSQSGGRFPEQVTPADKGLGNVRESAFAIFLPMQSLQAAADGNRLAYVFEYGNPESTAGGEMLELGTRGASSWQTEQLIGPSTTPSLKSTPLNKHGFLAAGQGEVQWLSPQLDCSFMRSRGFVNSETPPADVENDIWHLYRRDAAGNFKMVTPTPLNPSEDNGQIKVHGATTDCSRVIMSSGYKLLPGLPAPAGRHLYEWEETGGPGTLRVIDRLPDGSIPPAGIPDVFMALNEVSRPNPDRVFFTAISNEGEDAGNLAVFVRKNHAETVNASQSQSAVPNTGTTKIQMSSKDGSHVFFTAIAGLAANSTTTTGNSLYDYDVDTGVLRDLSPNSNPTNFAGSLVEGVMGASDDGSHVYFGAKGQLVPGQGKTYIQNLLDKSMSIYLSRDGVLSYVGSITDKDAGGDSQGFTLGTFVPVSPFGHYRYRLKTRVTPDGSHLLFASAVNLTPYDSAGKREIYLYSTEGPTISCISCRPDGLPPTVANEGLSINSHQQADTHFTRSITPDGSRVFFTSAEELVEGGTGEKNAYEWHDGVLTLLAREAEVMDSSLDGSDVFVRTDEPLVAQDRDSVDDFYDLRVNGGFTYFPPEPCDPLTEGSCQGTPPTPPAPGADPASSNFSGPGNPPAGKPKRKRCGKGKVRRRAKCVRKRSKCRKGKARRAKCVSKRSKCRKGRARRRKCAKRQRRSHMRAATQSRGGAK